MVNTNIKYRWDFIGLSTDDKPMPSESNKVVNGSTYYESDTSKLYVFYKDQWYERKPLGGGGGGGTDNYNDLSNLPKINNVELKGNKTPQELGLEPYHEEQQIKGWTSITQDVESELDIRPQLQAGYTRFTILVYIRKSNVRQGVKFELTSQELAKILSKVQRNMVCITRSCLNPNGDNSMAQLKQCVTAVYENNQPVDGLMHIKYNLYDYTGTSISSLDNLEWCMYAE